MPTNQVLRDHEVNYVIQVIDRHTYPERMNCEMIKYSCLCPKGKAQSCMFITPFHCLSILAKERLLSQSTLSTISSDTSLIPPISHSLSFLPSILLFRNSVVPSLAPRIEVESKLSEVKRPPVWFFRLL